MMRLRNNCFVTLPARTIYLSQNMWAHSLKVTMMDGEYLDGIHAGVLDSFFC
jgi:hypothetical protein